MGFAVLLDTPNVYLVGNGLYIVMIYIYIYIYEMSSSYTFFKPLNLSKSNGQKNALINANILIRISFIISYL